MVSGSAADRCSWRSRTRGASHSLGSTSSDLSRKFADTNQFDQFTALVAGLFGLSASVALSTLPTFRLIAAKASLPPKIAAIVFYLIVSVAVIVGPFIVQAGNAIIPLSNFSLRIWIIDLFVLACGSGSLCGLALLAHTQREITGRSGTVIASDEIRSILEARTYIQRFFVGAAALITMAVIVIGGLQDALKVDLSSYEDRFANGDILFIPNIASIPVGAILIYGVFFAALLAFAVIPAYRSWQARAADLRDRLYPLHDDGRAPPDWYEGRSNIEALLQMRPGYGSRVLTIVGILAPLIASIISIIIPALQS